MDAFVNWFNEYSGNAGTFVIETMGLIHDFVQGCPHWFASILVAILTMIVIRVLINVF